LTPTLRRALVLILLAAVTLAPAVARARLRVSPHPSPAQENSRFRWSNSCEKVPSRIAQDCDAACALPVFIARLVEPAPRHHAFPTVDLPPLVSPDHETPPGLRAPPVAIL